MAAQKLLRSCKICVENSGLAIAGGKEDFSGGNEQNLDTLSVPIDGGAWNRAPGELTWWWIGVHCDSRALLKKAHRKGFRGCIHSTFARRMNDCNAGQSCNAGALSVRYREPSRIFLRGWKGKRGKGALGG